MTEPLPLPDPDAETARVDQQAAAAGVHLPDPGALPLDDAHPSLRPAIRLFASLQASVAQHGVDVAPILSDARHKATVEALAELLPGFDPVLVEYRALRGVETMLVELLDRIRTAQARATLLAGIDSHPARGRR